MSKRKRTPKDTPPSPPAEGAEGAPTVHVGSDVLAGSPDIWAPGKDKPLESAEPEATSDVPVESSEPEATSDEAQAAAEAPPPSDEPALEEPATTDPAIVSAPPPPTYQPHPPPYVAPAPAARRAGSSIALGVVLVVLGLFALLVQFTGFDAAWGWPLFVVVPGLTLLLVGYISLGTGALIPGAILTIVGLILAYQSSTGDWTSWAFAWPLVAPGGVGLGLFLQGVRNHDAHLLRQGRVLMFVAAVIFMIAFVIFGAVLNLGGYNYGWFGKAALPALLIVVGIVLLARSIQRSRQS